jgi:uncharacterized membrane protein
MRHRAWYPWHHRRASHHPALRKLHDERTVGERVADNVAAFGGSWPFIFVFLGLMAAWILVNTLLLQRLLSHDAFDPYPYIALNLALSAMAGLQAPIIMMSQNRAAVRDEALASHHYDETQQLATLLRQNTDLTEQVRDLTAKVHELTREISVRVMGGYAPTNTTGPTDVKRPTQPRARLRRIRRFAASRPVAGRSFPRRG